MIDWRIAKLLVVKLSSATVYAALIEYLKLKRPNARWTMDISYFDKRTKTTVCENMNFFKKIIKYCDDHQLFETLLSGNLYSLPPTTQNNWQQNIVDNTAKLQDIAKGKKEPTRAQRKRYTSSIFFNSTM